MWRLRQGGGEKALGGLGVRCLSCKRNHLCWLSVTSTILRAFPLHVFAHVILLAFTRCSFPFSTTCILSSHTFSIFLVHILFSLWTLIRPSTRSTPPGRSTPKPLFVPLPGPSAPGRDRTTVSPRGRYPWYAVPLVLPMTSRLSITRQPRFSVKEPISITHCILPGPSRRSTPGGCWRVCNRRVG